MDITPARKMIQSEEVAYAAAVSSATGQRIGSSINFINERQKVHRTWQINGRYGTSTGSQSSVDGSIPIEEDLEIVGFYMACEVAGSSGITEIDIRRQVASGTNGSSLFSVNPSISFSAGNKSKLQVNYNPNETLHNPAGTVLPVFNSVLLDKGDSLFLDFVTRQLNGESLTVTLICRPR